MQHLWDKVLIAVVAISASLALGPACRPGHGDEPQPATATEEEQPMSVESSARVSIEVDAKEVEGWAKIPTIEVAPGQVVEFSAAPARVWVLIPDPYVEHIGGQGAWSRNDAFLAFEVLEDGATVRIAEDFPNEDRTVHYAVMVERGGRWSYVHGNNPPPGMIIRGQRE
jgi:hypothetical protein